VNRLVAILLIPFLVLGNSFAHAHGIVAQSPIGKSYTHVHIGSSSHHGHHDHESKGHCHHGHHHEHQDDEDHDDPIPVKPVDHDSDAVYVVDSGAVLSAAER